MLAIVGVASTWAGIQADSQERVANQRAAALKTSQERLLAMSKSIAESKPNPQIASELANAQALIKSREEIMRVLEGGVLGNTVGFSEFLRGFARQVPNGLWLTGFTIGAGGSEMEIRGRTLDPASLPEYIRRLKTEKVFQGLSFSSLTVLRPEEGTDKQIVAAPRDAKGALLPLRFVDFVLMPGTIDPAKPATATTAAAAPAMPSSLTAAAAMMPNALSNKKNLADALANPRKTREDNS